MTNVYHWVLALLFSIVHNISKDEEGIQTKSTLNESFCIVILYPSVAHFFTTTALSLFLCLASWTVDGREVVVANTGPSCKKTWSVAIV